MEPNFLTSLKFSRKGNTPQGADKINFSVPASGENTITVICGRNRTGKSYLLRVIKRCFESYNKKFEKNESYISSSIPDNDVQIEVTSTKFPINYFLISNVGDLLRYLKSITLERETKFRERGPRVFRMHYDDPVKLKIANELFAEDILKYLSKNTLQEDKWQNNDNYRHEIVTQILEKGSYYKLDSGDDLVEYFRKATGGHLYIAWNHALQKTNLSLFLYYDENRIISFENWSQGQKVLLLCLIITKYIAPEVMVFDEIETHLHPEFISILLEYFKKRVRQTILSSHHPHIIFSKYVNSVWYLEIDNQMVEYPDVIPNVKKGSGINHAPVRRCFELKKNYHKVAKVYDLFDSFDNTLIRLSQSTISDFNDFLADIFSSIYQYEIIASTPSKKIDLQAEGLLHHVFDKLDHNDTISILEIGSGKGRMLLDIAKLNNANLSQRVNWTLYEPIIPVYEKLMSNISKLKADSKLAYNIETTNSLELAVKFDIIFIANVLHELTPNIVANYFSRIPELLADNGEVIIIELYPLLQPEYFAVPYKRHEMEQQFRNLSWHVNSDNINIKNAKVDAYWTVLRKSHDTISDQKLVLETIESFWKNTISANRCADYGGRSEFKSPEESIRLMNELTTIASINSYFNKEWEMQIL